MHRQQRPHRRRIAPQQQCHAGKTRQEQHENERDIHAGAFLIDQLRIALPSFLKQAGGSHQKSDAAKRAPHHPPVPPPIPPPPPPPATIPPFPPTPRRTPHKNTTE